jgi:hypothetical protein
MPTLPHAKSLAAVSVAAFVASLAVFVSPAAPETGTALQPRGSINQPLSKGDRLSTPLRGAACSTQGWPHYERNCEFDMRTSADMMRSVRILDLHRPRTGPQPQNQIVAAR